MILNVTGVVTYEGSQFEHVSQEIVKFWTTEIQKLMGDRGVESFLKWGIGEDCGTCDLHVVKKYPGLYQGASMKAALGRFKLTMGREPCARFMGTKTTPLRNSAVLMRADVRLLSSVAGYVGAAAECNARFDFGERPQDIHVSNPRANTSPHPPPLYDPVRPCACPCRYPSRRSSGA